MDLSQQSGPIEHNNALTAVPQSDIDNLINQSSQSSATEALHTSAGNNDLYILSGIANDLKLEQKKGPAVHEQLAKVVQSLMQEKLEAQTQKCYLTPENCDSLTTTKVNHLIWDKFKPKTCSGDIQYHSSINSSARENP